MSFNRAKAIDEQFIAYCHAPNADPAVSEAWPRSSPIPSVDSPVRGDSPLTGAQLLDLFDSQIICRHLDLIARILRGRDAGYYTISSAGHEGNAVLGLAVRHTDPTFLHYRSGALMVQRSKQRPEIDPIFDTLLSQAAAADDPIAGGRHKVWGSVPLWVPPQTSTIASHLPKALGAAIAIGRARRMSLPLPVPVDSIAMCTFGDASVNHAVAQTAFNAAGWTAFQRIPAPILYVCEDNGIGISTRTPPGWVRANISVRSGLHYIEADGLDLPNAYARTVEAVDWCRRHRAPVFLHIRTIRMLGHAGSDVETEYHTLAEIEAVEKCDPLLRTAQLVIDSGLLSREEVLEHYESIRARVAEAAEVVVLRPKLKTSAEVMRPLAPYHANAVQAEAVRQTPATDAAAASPRAKRHMAALINRVLHESLEKYPEAVLFGEDVAQRGGVYYCTAGLHKKFGPSRVFNTLLDETTILGLAIGAAHLGFIPIPEIQYLAYVHNAEDQIRGEACSLQYFSNAQYRNPMVIRIAGYAYQRGFGGHFHNDNSIAALRDIPGLIIATPSRGDDAVRMFRTCMALAKIDGRVIAWIEPIALYMTKDLHVEGDAGWSFEYPEPGDVALLGEGRVYEPRAKDLTIITYANGVHMSLRAAKTLVDTHGIHARIVDLRWLNPLNHDFIAQQALATGRVLVMDECRRAGGLGEAIVAGIVERCGGKVAIQLMAADDSYVPLGPAMRVVMPTEERIVEAVTGWIGQARGASMPDGAARRITAAT